MAEESGIGVVEIDEDGNMICTKHPYNNSKNPGGICAICLQEKLGNLVSSTTSFRSESSNSTATSRTFGHSQSTNNGHGLASSDKKPPRIPFLFYRKRSTEGTSVTLQRSKSTAFSEGEKRKSFWSFLYYSRRGGGSSDGGGDSLRTTPATTSVRASSVRQGIIAEEEEVVDESPGLGGHRMTVANKAVSRSRSVGCGGGGSRSFSGDFFERLGDCTIRRVESQRQSNVEARDVQRKGINERVRCGGIFGGFNLTSSSSSSSSSLQWVPPSTAAEESHGTGGVNANVVPTATAASAHGRSRSWAWALASPLRAFGKPASDTSLSNKNAAQAAVPSPSLLSVSS